MTPPPLRFEITDVGGMRGVLPVLRDQTLVELVGGFETRHRFRPAGGYDAFVPGTWGVTDLAGYHLGTAGPKVPRIWLLGCECGESGCWPLEAEVTATDTDVTWAGFSQPHRPEWSYAGFGPFLFARADYDAAVQDLVDRWG